MLKLKRARFIFSPNESEAALKISSLQLSDEAVYRCEITYLEINEGCPVVQYVNLTVYGMVLVYMYGGLFFLWVLSFLLRLLLLLPCSRINLLFFLSPSTTLSARRFISIIMGFLPFYSLYAWFTVQ